jgi:hypothetical protein
MLDQALEALKTLDWGQDLKPLAPIEKEIIETHGNAAKRKELEEKLVGLLKTELPLDAKQYICRKLMVIGTAAAVPTLAAMLTDKPLAHMSRFALERITAPEAAAALRESLPKLAGELKAGAAILPWLGLRLVPWVPFGHPKLPKRWLLRNRAPK